MERLRSKDSNDRAEYVRLFEVDVDEICALLFDIINGPPDVNRFQASR